MDRVIAQLKKALERVGPAGFFFDQDARLWINAGPALIEIAEIAEQQNFFDGSCSDFARPLFNLSMAHA